MLRVAAIACLAGALLLPGSALAAFPGVNGPIAFTAYHSYTEQCAPGADYPSGTATDAAIFSMNPGGSGASQVTATQHTPPRCYVDSSGYAYDQAPSYARSGKRLVFSQEWYADGAGGVDVEVINADGTNRRRLAQIGTTEYSESPAFSPDGNWIAFTDHWDPTPSQTSWISIVRTDGTPKRRVTKETRGVRVEDPTFFPDGKTIAFESRSLSDPTSHISTIRLDGTHPHRLTDQYSDFFPDVAPDGSKIVFNRAVGRRAGIYVMRADGTHQRRLAEGYDPVFSPNGARIAFSSHGKIVVMMADGSDKHALIPNPLPFGVTDPSHLAIGQPSWGPKP